MRIILLIIVFISEGHLLFAQKSNSINIGNDNQVKGLNIKQDNSIKFLYQYNTCIKYVKVDLQENVSFLYPILFGMSETLNYLSDSVGNIGIANRDSLKKVAGSFKKLLKSDLSKVTKEKVKATLESGFILLRNIFSKQSEKLYIYQNELNNASILLNELICAGDEINIEVYDDSLVTYELATTNKSNISDIAIYPPIQGYSKFKINGKWGLTDVLQKIIIEPKYDSIWDPSDGYVLLRAGDIYEFESLSTRKRIKLNDYLEAYPFSGGWACIKEGQDAFSYIDTVGRKFDHPTIINISTTKGTCQFSLLPFNTNVNGAYINFVTGELSPIFNEVTDFNSAGIAVVLLDGFWHLIDTSFNRISKRFQFIHRLENEFFIASNLPQVVKDTVRNCEMGFMSWNIFDNSGTLLSANGSYHGITKAIKNYIVVSNCSTCPSSLFRIPSPYSACEFREKVGLVNLYGMEIFPIEYDRIEIVNNSVVKCTIDNYEEMYYVDALGRKRKLQGSK